MKASQAIVIDDDMMIREILGHLLEAEGFEVLKAENGEEALGMIREDQDVTLAIVDIIMPKKEGIETILEIRAFYPEMKIIAISGGGAMKSNELLGYAQRLGANAIFEKPLDLEKVMNTALALIGMPVPEKEADDNWRYASGD
jgi:DNA-binding NtrC family response regulator